MRNPASPELLSRPQIQAMEALIASGGLARGRRGHRQRPAKSAQVESLAGVTRQLSNSEVRVAPNGIELLQASRWRQLDWLWHGFSTRRGEAVRPGGASGAGGELNLGFTSDDDQNLIAQNRARLVEAVTGDAATRLVTVKQIHSNIVLHVERSDAELKPPRKADGVMTDEPGMLLAVMTADCIPVLVADRRRRVIAAFHAGWRGTVKRIVECGVGRMRLEFGSRAEDLIAAIGPGIGGCCYAVGEDVQAAFESQFVYWSELFTEVYDPDPVRLKYPMLFLNQRAPGHAPPMMSVHLDLVEANRRQLIDAGLKADNIQSVGGCTSCHSERFFSHRAEQGRTGRMMAVIGIRGGKND